MPYARSAASADNAQGLPPDAASAWALAKPVTTPDWWKFGFGALVAVIGMKFLGR